MQGLLKELRTAVKLRQVSDVPVGVFLSGGIDSSTNAALFSENSATPVNTFSIGYKGKYGSYENELHYAKEMADFVSANYHEKILTIDDLLDFYQRWCACKMNLLQIRYVYHLLCVKVS